MVAKAENIAQHFLKREWNKLTKREQKVVESLVNQSTVSRNTFQDYRDSRTFGEKLADKIASFGGSWTFIIIFGVILICWVILNSLFLLGRAFDPYPYILLNLFLSMIAALQAPVIMMSQNRQSARDRLDAAHDYEVNLKAELEIRDLHGKLDEIREHKWLELIEMQQRQINLLEKLVREQLKTDRLY